MENRITIVNMIIEEQESAVRVNDILHEYGKYIIGRLGLPYSEKDVSVICVIMDSPQSVASAISGKLGMIKGVTAKTMTAKI